MTSKPLVSSSGGAERLYLPVPPPPTPCAPGTASLRMPSHQSHLSLPPVVAPGNTNLGQCQAMGPGSRSTIHTTSQRLLDSLSVLVPKPPEGLGPAASHGVGGSKTMAACQMGSSASSGIRLCPWGLAAQGGNLEPLRPESCFEHPQPSHPQDSCTGSLLPS